MSSWDNAQTLGSKAGVMDMPTGTTIKLTQPTIEQTSIDTVAIATSEEPVSLLDELQSQVSEFEQEFHEQWETQPDPQLSPVPEGAQSITPPPRTPARSLYEHPMLTTGLLKRKG